MKPLVTLAAPALTGPIAWGFGRPLPRAQLAGPAPVTVLVKDGVYSPARIEVRAGETLVLRFVREDPSPCAAKVIFDQLQVSADLPIGKSYELRVTPPAPGEYVFTCEMQMYRGSVVAK